MALLEDPDARAKFSVDGVACERDFSLVVMAAQISVAVARTGRFMAAASP